MTGKNSAMFMRIQEKEKPRKVRVRPRLSRRTAIQAFTPFERAVLSDLFKVPIPRIARDVDIWMTVNSEGELLLDWKLSDELYPDLSLRNAAAQIILRSTADQLPSYYSFATEEFARKPNKAGARGKAISLRPQHVLTVNWANSGPCCSWPEFYYLTYVTGYDRYVVTASSDSPDAFGCEDFVLGWFSSRRDIRHSVGRILCRFWRRLYRAWEHEHWAEYWGGGLIDRDYANQLAYWVWDEYERGYMPPAPEPRKPPARKHKVRDLYQFPSRSSQEAE